jgi:hypothetical protein
LIQHLPEAVIDRLLERKASRQREQAGLPITALQQPDETGQSLSFEELLALAQPPDLELDSYSARGVLLAVPRSATVLSSLRLAPTLFRQRYEVTTQSGEGAPAGDPAVVTKPVSCRFHISADCL